MKKIIYMDNAATTRVRKEVLDAMMPYLTDKYGNPSSIYSLAQESASAINEARRKVATALNAQENEIYFTSGGTESDNWAIKGVADANKEKGRHIITTSIEHHAVLHTCQYLEKQGFEVTYLPVASNGIINLDELKKAIREDTVLISIMFANNEIGSIQPIAEIGKIAKEKGIYFHTDAVQAVGHIPIDVNELNIDLLSLSAHKFNGPKGVGALYIRNGTKISNLLHGGAQERRLRAGTENVAGIVGLGTAIELAVRDMTKNSEYVTELRDRLINGLLKIPDTILNGDSKLRLPGNVNVCLKHNDGRINITSA